MNQSLPMLTVSQLNEYVKSLVDASSFLNKVYVKGEISNFKNHYTGHFYFILKDEQASLKVVMFSSYASKLEFMPKDSMQVLISGKISVFPRDGTYQLYAQSLEPLGKGALYEAFEQMKSKLESKGFFDIEHKKPIPKYPQKIGIVTSPIGAAVADMKNIISRRYPIAQVFIYPSLVQGEGAVKNLCEGISYFDSENKVDVIIIGRGGGSIEDLWSFNSEALAGAIFKCKTPIISAVGHETDYTISDLVSDLRAPTPSAAAELAVPDKQELLQLLTLANMRLDTAISTLLSEKNTEIKNLAEKKCFSSAKYLTEKLNEQIAEIDRRITKCGKEIISTNTQKIQAVASRLSALNPMNVLSRGYSAIFSEQKVISSIKQVNAGDKLTLVLADGEINTKVIDKAEK